MGGHLGSTVGVGPGWLWASVPIIPIVPTVSQPEVAGSPQPQRPEQQRCQEVG